MQWGGTRQATRTSPTIVVGGAGEQPGELLLLLWGGEKADGWESEGGVETERKNDEAEREKESDWKEKDTDRHGKERVRKGVVGGRK